MLNTCSTSPIHWEENLVRSGRLQYPIALLLMDADRFKSVNDTQGHLVGDMVLRAIGEAVQAVTTSASLAARLGGDEFAIAISHANDRDLLATAAEIRRAFAVAIAKLGVDTTLSIGIASSEDCPRHQLFAAADSALYRSKAAGGDRAEVFNADGLGRYHLSQSLQRF
jgi:diguanylate cyclase (GGDEF)-like protein